MGAKNLEVQQRKYCDGCTLFELDADELEIETFESSYTQVVIFCKHNNACQRMYKLCEGERHVNRG